ncbi:MAG: radical SAM protein [Planctomycetota bacterium]
MAVRRPLILVVPGPRPFAAPAESASLQRRLTRLVEGLPGAELAALAGAAIEGLPRLADGPSVSAALREAGADALLVVEDGQWFLDPEVVRNGLVDFDPTFHDHFTQWEHCRLPVGVGLRGLAARTWLELAPAHPDEAFAALRARPAGRRFCYDVGQRVPFAESLLDARRSPALIAALRESPFGGRGLADFRDLAAGREAGLRYQPPGDAPRMDERRMPAVYGFESADCATFPTYVMFDVTNLCNARCVHCPQSLRGEDGEVPAFLREKEHQSLAAFQSVIDECATHGVQFVRITADGEPLVHPHLFEMLEYARDRGVGPVGLTTNASLLRPDKAERLLDSGVAMVDFSLDAASQATFDAIRVGLSYERTLANVEHFLRRRDERGSPVRVVVSFVKQAANLHEVEAFRARWEPRVDEVVVREMISNVGLNDPTESAWPGWDARWPCAHFFRRVVINHQGTLKACPIDWEQRTVNLPVSAESVVDQWHGDFYWSHRMQHLNDRIVASSACSDCRDWAGTPWDLGYEKIVARLVS